jgi:two-component sensor histidine kinase
MKAYLPKLVKSMGDTSEHTKNKITINIDAIDLFLPLTKAVPIGLLTTELLMNVFKHAFTNQKEGHIEVTLRRNNNQIELTVADDGEGLPDDFNLDSDSLGMNIINNLVYQIEGNISFNSEPNEGTTFTVTFTHEKS